MAIWRRAGAWQRSRKSNVDLYRTASPGYRQTGEWSWLWNHAYRRGRFHLFNRSVNKFDRLESYSNGDELRPHHSMRGRGGQPVQPTLLPSRAAMSLCKCNMQPSKTTVGP